jgi:phage-related protein
LLPSQADENHHRRRIKRLEQSMLSGMTVGGKKSSPANTSGLRFPKTILVQVEGRWHVVASADEALQCLRDVFPDRNGPSHRRAVDTCAALFLDNTTAEGAQATFIVAAMEGGHPFEVHDDGAELVERLVVAATENGLLDMLLEVDQIFG